MFVHAAVSEFTSFQSIEVWNFIIMLSILSGALLLAGAAGSLPVHYRFVLRFTDPLYWCFRAGFFKKEGPSKKKKKPKKARIAGQKRNASGFLLGAARLAQLAVHDEADRAGLLKPLPLEQAHRPDDRRVAHYAPQRETFRQIYQQLKPLMS